MSSTTLATMIMTGLLVRSLALGDQQCHSISPAASDAWCQKNCNWNPPNCPATLCKCGAPGPTPPPTPPSPSPPTPAAPLSPEDTVKYLNDFYTGFNESDPKSPLGVTITMTSNPNTFYGNIYCSTFNNPNGNTSCHKGFADCRLSASLYNHKMIVNTADHKIVLGLQKTTGYVINQSRVEAYLSKCSYIWDGASQNRLNRGCGNVPAIGLAALNCSNPQCAFYNYCPSTKQTCSLNATEVHGSLCQAYGGPLPIPSYPQMPACMFPGPSIDWHEQANYKPQMSYLRDMVKARATKNFMLDQWNEVVIDETLMLRDISQSSADAAQVVTAFVYAKSGLPASKNSAENMRDEYCKINKVTPPIPVVEIDDVTFQPNGPFNLPSAESILLV